MEVDKNQLKESDPNQKLANLISEIDAEHSVNLFFKSEALKEENLDKIGLEIRQLLLHKLKKDFSSEKIDQLNLILDNYLNDLSTLNQQKLYELDILLNKEFIIIDQGRATSFSDIFINILQLLGKIKSNFNWENFKKDSLIATQKTRYFIYNHRVKQTKF